MRRQERQLEALRSAGAHLVALDKAEAALERARRRLAGEPEVDEEEAAAAAARRKKKTVSTLDTRLSIDAPPPRQRAKGGAGSIFDDFDEMPTKKSSSARKARSLFD